MISVFLRHKFFSIGNTCIDNKIKGGVLCADFARITAKIYKLFAES